MGQPALSDRTDNMRWQLAHGNVVAQLPSGKRKASDCLTRRRPCSLRNFRESQATWLHHKQLHFRD
jgi:hypothetical protein